MDDIKKICKTYEKEGGIKATSKVLGISWNRVVKVLSSEGYILNDNHEVILDLHSQGKSVEEISAEVGLSTKTVQAYLPAQRPYYNYKQSKNALKIKACRQRKKLKEQEE